MNTVCLRSLYNSPYTHLGHTEQNTVHTNLYDMLYSPKQHIYHAFWDYWYLIDYTQISNMLITCYKKYNTIKDIKYVIKDKKRKIRILF